MNNTQKKMGLFSLLTMSVGVALGSGAFTLMTAAIGYAGRSLCIAVLVGSVLAMLMTLPTLFLSSAIDLTGGEYTRGIALLPVGLAGVNGVIKLVSPFGFAVYFLGMASYTLQLLPGVTGLYKFAAVLYMIIFFLIGVKGFSATAKTQNIMVVCLFLALGIFLFGGLPNLQPKYFSKEDFFHGGTSGFLYASSMMTMAASSAGGILNLTSVAKNPKRNIPLAIFLSSTIVAVFNFLIAMVTAGILPVDVVHNGNLGMVAETFLPKPLFIFFIIGGALFALGSSVNGLLSTVYYPWEKMAEDGWLPKFILKKDQKFKYPYIVMGLLFVVGGVFPIVFDLDISTIASFSSFPNFILNAYVTLMTLTLPKKYPHRWANASMHVSTPILALSTLLAVAACSFVAVNLIKNLNSTMVIGMCAVLIIVSIYVMWRYKAGYVNVDHILQELQDTPYEGNTNSEKR